MIDVNHLCPGCMGYWPDTTFPCSHCGFSWGQHPSSGRELPPFTILAGRYLLGTKLGSGGFGITYLAMDLVEETPVAIKEFFPSNLAHRENKQILPFPGEEGRIFREAMRSFRREGALMAKFRGTEGVVSQRDFVEENGTSYLVMDYVSGETLMQHMRRTGTVYTQEEAIRLMQPILRAVDIMHQNHILHRDISPENLILGPDGKLTLIDFGAAREFDLEGEENLTVILKHGYAPEEQYRSGSRQGPWTDLYACCAVLYQMVSGIRPQDADQRKHRDQLLPLDEIEGVQVTHSFARAIEKGLTVHATERYPSIQALLDDLGTGMDCKPAAPMQPLSPSLPSQEEFFQPPETAPTVESTPPLQPEISKLTPPSRPKKKKLPWWGKATAIAAAVGLVIFLGRYFRFGGTDTAPIPEIYGNVQEDGTTWVQTVHEEYRGELYPETNKILWEPYTEEKTEWDFREEEIQSTILYEGYSTTWRYDNQGNLLSMQFGSGARTETRTEYQYDGDTCVATTYGEDGQPNSTTTIQYDNSGQYTQEHILKSVQESHDPDTGALSQSVNISYTHYDDGTYEMEQITEDHLDNTVLKIHNKYRTGDFLIERLYEEERADGFKISQRTDYTYDENGYYLSERTEWTQYDSDGGETTHVSETEYSYQFDEMGQAVKKIATTTEEDTVQIVHGLYTYDQWGNLLTQLEYAEGESEVWFSSYTYAEYTPTGSGSSFDATGNTSGSEDPPKYLEGVEAPQGNSTPAESVTDLQSASQELLEFLQESTNLQIDSLALPQQYSSETAVKLALKAGGIDGAVGIFEEECIIPANTLLVLPPLQYQTKDGHFLSVCCNSMDAVWEISMSMLENGYYEESELWAVPLTKMQEGEKSILCWVTDDEQYQLFPSELQHEFLRPYLEYWGKQTGGKWKILNDSGITIDHG